jgi:hypothetical protein
VRWGWLVFLDVDDLPEDADHVAAALEWDGADLDRDALACWAEDDALVVGALGGSGEVAGEDLAGAA